MNRSEYDSDKNQIIKQTLSISQNIFQPSFGPLWLKLTNLPPVICEHIFRCYPPPPVILANRHVSPEAEVDLWDLLETYREAVGDKFVDLYDMFSSNLNASDDLLIFHFDMLSHVNAQLRELMNNERQGCIPVEDGLQSWYSVFK